MENGQLPKSLHTVRILVAVAADYSAHSGVRDAAYCVKCAAVTVGYPDASPDDPLIVKAVTQLAGLFDKARAFATAA